MLGQCVMAVSASKAQLLPALSRQLEHVWMSLIDLENTRQTDEQTDKGHVFFYTMNNSYWKALADHTMTNNGSEMACF